MVACGSPEGFDGSACVSKGSVSCGWESGSLRSGSVTRSGSFLISFRSALASGILASRRLFVYRSPGDLRTLNDRYRIIASLLAGKLPYRVELFGFFQEALHGP